MKRIISIILTVLLLLSFAGCGASETVTRDAHVEGSIFGGKSDDSIAVKLNFNPDWITKGDNTKYNKDLAAFSALLSADTYFRTKDLAKCTQNRVLIDGDDPEEYDWTTMLTDLGFSDVRHIESFKDGLYTSDVNDSVTMNLGYMQSGDSNIFVVAVRGCFSSGEWVSAFDLGADCDEYIKYTGEHPDWLNHDNLKGLDVAANRALDFIGQYVMEHSDNKNKHCVLITGHSRGGSIAQIIGSTLESSEKFKCFTYTFNALPVTAEPIAETFETVFNVTDEGDFFGNLFAFSGEAFYRCGTTIIESIAGSEAALGEISKLKGREDYTGLTADQIAEYKELFGKHFKDRTSLYETKQFTGNIDTNDPNGVGAVVEQFNTIISSESGLGLEDLVSACKSDDYTFTVEYCDAAQIQCIGKVLTYGASAAEMAKELFSGDVEFCNIIDFITLHFAEISGGHLLVNTYALSQNVK